MRPFDALTTDVEGYHLCAPSPQRMPAEYVRYAGPEAGLAPYASSSGIDFPRYAPDKPIRYAKNNAIESVMKKLTGAGRAKLPDEHAAALVVRGIAV